MRQTRHRINCHWQMSLEPAQSLVLNAAQPVLNFANGSLCTAVGRTANQDDCGCHSVARGATGGGASSTTNMTTPTQTQHEEPAVLTSAERAQEATRLKAQGLMEELFNQTTAELQSKLDEAASELDREMGVRERCFPGWIETGKVSRIDARDRFTRMKKAQEIINFLLDIAGKPVRMTTDDVPF